MSALMDQFGWISLIIGIVLIWLVIKVVRKVFMTVMAIVFTAIGIVRLWGFIGTL